MSEPSKAAARSLAERDPDERDPEARSPPFQLHQVERAPLSVLVSRQLRDAIVSGRISLGTEMPSEKDLSRDLGVSRSTIREALRILQAQGLLSGGDTVSTQRPRVSSESTVSTAASAMENVLRLGKVPLRDLVELRCTIEGAAIEAAAERRDAPSLAEARAAVSAMQRRGVDVATFRAADVRLHLALVAASGNAAYPLVMGVLRDTIAGHLGEALDHVDDAEATMRRLTREHDEIVCAVERGHGKRARQLVTDHIRTFYRENESRWRPSSKR